MEQEEYECRRIYDDTEFNDVKMYLKDGEWHIAKDIELATGVSSVKLRSMGNLTGAFVSGYHGYKLLTHATLDEYNRTLSHLDNRVQGLINHKNTLIGAWLDLQ